ncbi:hypothetical protein LIER_26363 [Lithospermum erythrorhizon]|uniref:Uncharacterized protein n=1 Tax=Lithospermum erythrorhizon TaxID=34254 RepID=A0AAV3R9L9_LITER
MCPAPVQAPPAAHLLAHVPVPTVSHRAPAAYDNVPAQSPAHASAPTPAQHTAQKFATAAQAPAPVLAQADHVSHVHAAHSNLHTHARRNSPTSYEANIVPQAKPSTMDKPSYAQAALSFAPFCMAEDTIPQPCLDFQNLKPVACNVAERRNLWVDLRNYAQNSTSWIVMGDFNAIVSGEEQIGGNAPNDVSMADFNQCLLDCNLLDDGFVG